jgi:hypothetical protein
MCLFNNTVSSDYIELSGVMIGNGELWMAQKECVVTNASVRIPCLLAEIRTRYLPNTKQGC